MSAEWAMAGGDKAASQPVDRASVGMLLCWGLIAMSWWGMAFYPVPQGSSSWLAQAQYACFGKMPGQPLPISGWLLLFGGPGALLLSLFVVYGRELGHSLRSLARSRRTAIFLIAFAALFVAESGWVAYRIRSEYLLSKTSFDAVEAGALPENYPRTSLITPEFSLIDQYGHRLTAAELKGRPTVLTFVFAHCASVCPALLKSTLGALERFSETEVRGVFITLDPWRDRPSALPSLARKWKLPSNAHLLSGKVDDVTGALERFNVQRTRDEKTGDVVHPSLVYVLDKDGRIAYSFNGPTTQWLADALGKLKL